MSELENESCPLNEQAIGFTVHALEPDEEIAMLRHLPLCASCRAVVGDAEMVFSRLGAAVEQVDPPSSLKASLMARVAETPQATVPTDTGTGRSERETEQRTATEPGGRSRRSTPSSRPEPARPPRGSWLSRRGRRLVAATVALVGVLAIGGLVIRTAQLEQQRDAQVAQSQSVTQLLEQLGRPGTEYALLAEDGGPTVAAVLVADGQRQVFSIGLPANTTDRDTYVLWGIAATGGDPRPLGTFDVAPAQPGVHPVGTIPGGTGFGTYAISIEPGRVAPAVPTKIVGSGDVTA